MGDGKKKDGGWKGGGEQREGLGAKRQWRDLGTESHRDGEGYS